MFFRVFRWGEWCLPKMVYVPGYSKQSFVTIWKKNTFLRLHDIFFSCFFFLSKRPVVHRGFCLVRSRVDVDFRHQRNTNLEAQSHPRLIRIAIHLRFRFLRLKEFLVEILLYFILNAIDPETMINPQVFVNMFPRLTRNQRKVVDAFYSSHHTRRCADQKSF